ncbi:MAG TPA: diguanylate cyclase [Limnochordia bacterium]|nr:diguanylate cyclase [Limnochordia bacterium]
MWRNQRTPKIRVQGILSMLLSLRLVLILVLLALFQGVGEHEIRALGTRLVEAVADLKLQSGSEAITPSISLGATFFSAIDTKYADALNRADRALYQAKELGKNRACFADCDAS